MRPQLGVMEAAGKGHSSYSGAQVAKKDSFQHREALSGAFFWLTAFYFVYCARPVDLFPPLGIIQPAKLTGALATLGLIASIGRTPRRLKDLPREAFYLLALIFLLFLSAVLSPVWKGGAFFTTVAFAKVCVVWVLTFLLVTTLTRLRRVIFLQSASVAVISFAAIIKGHSVPRLAGVIGGFFSNPNDMAFAIVLSMPFCVAFFLSASGALRKALWCVGMLGMIAALMLTASRAGLIDLIVAGTVLLWEFGVKGKRFYLIVGAIVICLGLMMVAGKQMAVRFNGILYSGESAAEDTAHESYEERKLLMSKALEAIAHYPILGVGSGNFVVYSGLWRDVHASYLQIAADGGIPVLVLYLMFFRRGFANLRSLTQMKTLDAETILFAGALKSSLVGFVVGACFAPEAYQFFPYFTVCYTSVLLAMAKERIPSTVQPQKVLLSRLHQSAGVY